MICGLKCQSFEVLTLTGLTDPSWPNRSNRRQRFFKPKLPSTSAKYRLIYKGGSEPSSQANWNYKTKTGLTRLVFSRSILKLSLYYGNLLHEKDDHDIFHND